MKKKKTEFVLDHSGIFVFKIIYQQLGFHSCENCSLRETKKIESSKKTRKIYEHILRIFQSANRYIVQASSRNS